MSDFETSPNLRPSTFSESAKMLASHIPEGRAFDAKTVTGTNINSLVKGTSKEYSRVEQSFNALLSDFDIELSDQTLSLWEASIGIPDQSFDGLGSIEERRTDVLIKYSKLRGTVTPPQWDAVALLFGFDIELLYGSKRLQFPLQFPLPFFNAISSNFVWFIRVFNAGTMDTPLPTDPNFIKFVSVANILNPADHFVFTDQSAIDIIFAEVTAYRRVQFGGSEYQFGRASTVFGKRTAIP